MPGHTGPRLSYEKWTDLDTQVILQPAASGGGFRVTGFRETVHLAIAPDQTLSFEYMLICVGPKQTVNGRDHATRSGNMGFSPDNSWHPWQDLPAEVRLAAAGPAALIESLGQAFVLAKANTTT